MSVSLVPSSGAVTPNIDGLADWLFSSSPDCVKIIDLEGNLVSMNNNGMCAMEIDDFDSVYGAAWASLWSEEVRSNVHSAVSDARSGKVGHFNAYGKTMKGTPKWWDVMVTPVRDTNGRITKLLSVSRDVTSVHQAKLVAEKSEARFRSVVKAVSSIVWFMPAEGGFAEEQPEWTAFTGQSLPELSGSGWLRAVHPDDRNKTILAANNALHAREAFHMQHRLRRHDGTYRLMHVRVVPVIAANGSLSEWVGVHTDIQEQHERDLALTAKDSRLWLASEAAHVGIWTWQPSTDQVTWENEWIHTIFELPLGAPAVNAETFRATYVHPDDAEAFNQAIARTLETRERFYFQGRIRQAISKQIRWVEFFAMHQPDVNGLAGLIGTVSDITERKKDEEALRNLANELREADRLKSEFIVTLAHELRNPLAPIRNGLQLMKMSGDNPQTISRVRGVLERQVTQMTHLIDDLLDTARISKGQIELRKEVIDFKLVAADAVETSLPLIEAKHHELIVDLAEEALPIDVDRVRIAQVISNLLNNAAKYTPANGKIILAAVRDGADLVVTVTDTGIGIPEEALTTVFRMFSQVKGHKDFAQGGLGIGLSLARSLVHLHGGTISVLSAGAGQGSTFVVRLSVADRAA